MAPAFSIIIPTLNEEVALPHLISDLQNQTFNNFEVFMVDANSKDKTIEIAKKAESDARFTTITSPEQNVSVQRNFGASKAKGDWLIFFDADSRIESGFLKELGKQLSKYPCDACNLFAEPDRKDKSSTLFVAAQNIALYTLTTVGIPYAIGACFVCKRAVFEKVQGFNPQIHHMEDSELARRIKDAGFNVRMLVTPKYTYSLRRQRKEGTLKIIAANYPYYLKSLIANEFVTPQELYPMKGGSSHHSKRRGRV
jgi:glycosyltransferase involved in cell wall biosynthesis